MSTKTVKNIREPLKKPRPLKTASVEQIKDSTSVKARADLLSELEMLNVQIGNCDFNEAVASDISRMYTLLKTHGEELDTVHKDALDRYFSTLRNMSREDRLDIVSRLKLLEIIEIRAMHWKVNENDSNYFNIRLSQLQEAHEGGGQHLSGSVSPSAVLSNQNQSFTSNASLSPGEFLRSSGKFSKPTKIAGKNFYKDEIVIRNCDSGKVMGIKGRRVHMIEELSDTVISFQRVNAGARDRLVQITGPHEEAISHAKFLVEDTIKRNVSPVRENLNTADLSVDNKEHVDFGSSSYFDRSAQVPSSKRTLSHSFSMSDASTRDFSIPVQIGHDVIVLSGSKADLLKRAQVILMDYFAGALESSLEQDSNNVSQSKVNNNHQRFTLKRQSSLKENLPGTFSSVSRGGFSRQSSSMSSSSDDILPDEESSDLEAISPPVPAPIPPPSYPSHQVYSREFLLECARLPLSKKQPPDYEAFTSAYPELRPQTPVLFNPSPYLQAQSVS